MLGLWADASDPKGTGAVAVEPIDKGTNINFHDVSFFKNPFSRRDSVNDLIVDTDTGTGGEAAIAEERGFCTRSLDVRANYIVEVLGADPRPDMARELRAALRR